MHRQPLLTALEFYARRHPDEAATTSRFRDFVEAQPRCFERSLEAPGHVTGSAWILSPDGNATLLTHHRKLDMWIQLGGHADGDADVVAVALREGLEESGLAALELLDPLAAADAEPSAVAVPFDLDIHVIPARRSEPEHLHFDVRYAFRAGHTEVRVSDESHDLAWVPLDALWDYTNDVSVVRMATKWARRPGAERLLVNRA
ncbi:MAG TPA: NUDIX hydrolase [Pseudomonadales bacterium]|nr:NUDIX hydrolase [Pseudomonadales bacterium]